MIFNDRFGAQNNKWGSLPKAKVPCEIPDWLRETPREVGEAEPEEVLAEIPAAMNPLDIRGLLHEVRPEVPVIQTLQRAKGFILGTNKEIERQSEASQLFESAQLPTASIERSFFEPQDGFPTFRLNFGNVYLEENIQTIDLLDTSTETEQRVTLSVLTGSEKRGTETHVTYNLNTGDLFVNLVVDGKPQDPFWLKKNPSREAFSQLLELVEIELKMADPQDEEGIQIQAQLLRLINESFAESQTLAA